MVLDTMCQAKENRAVSPVIGVILMVAITVILAAVIGAFVLEIGDQQETAPSTSFDSSQVTKSEGGNLNWTNVGITHAGGDVLDVDALTTKVEGNESVYRMERNADQLASQTTRTKVFPTQTIPKSEADPRPSEPWTGYFGEEMTSGQTIDVEMYGVVAPQNLYKCMRDNNWERVQIGAWKTAEDFEKVSVVALGGGGSGCHHVVNLLGQGQEVNVVWEASSGGKTQTLFKYGVQ
jgi:flagellin-like protein